MLAAINQHSALMLRHRLLRKVRRVVSDAFGKEVELAIINHHMV